MLSEQDKLDAMAAATVLINPSPFESFSIVVFEAMLCGTPVLVNGRCDVLRGHVQRSNAGLYYESGFEFVEALRLMLAMMSYARAWAQTARPTCSATTRAMRWVRRTCAFWKSKPVDDRRPRISHQPRSGCADR